MRVWLFQIGEPLPFVEGARKMRTALLAEEFRRRGHEVVWWASGFDHQQKQWLTQNQDPDQGSPEIKELPDGTQIVLLRGCGYEKNLSLKRFYDHRLVSKDFRAQAGKFDKPDLIVASMPSYDLSNEAIEFGYKNNIPSYIDIRDQWPDIFLDYIPEITRPFAKLALTTEYKMLKNQFKKATGLLSMMGEILNWGLDYAGRAKTKNDRVFYLGCPKHSGTPEALGKGDPVQAFKEQIAGRKVVTFIGTFGHYYNPEIVAKVARKSDPKKVCYLIGGDGVFFDSVSELTSDLSHVFLPGWLSQNQMNHVLALTDLAVVPATKPIPAFPNKAFVYLSAGIPVVSSCQGDLKELLQENSAGFYYPPGDQAQLESVISDFLKMPEQEVSKLNDGANKLFNEKLEAANIYKEFVDHLIENIVDSKNENISDKREMRKDGNVPQL